MARQCFCICPVLRLAADIGFVGFHEFAFATHRFRDMRLAHPFADTVGHEPCRPIGAKAKLTPKLVRAHSLLARAKQMSCKQPFMERDMTALVQGADRRRERLATVLALVDTRS